eukprot:6330331-Ditylum_brightwellii.AAC.1
MLYRKPLTTHPVPAPSALPPNTEHDCGCASCSGAKSHGASCTCDACAHAAHPSTCVFAAYAPVGHLVGCSCAGCSGRSFLP